MRVHFADQAKQARAIGHGMVYEGVPAFEPGRRGAEEKNGERGGACWAVRHKAPSQGRGRPLRYATIRIDEPLTPEYNRGGCLGSFFRCRGEENKRRGVLSAPLFHFPGVSAG